MAKRRMRDPYQLRAQADRISKEIIDLERSARETKTAGLHFRARMLECLARTTLCVEHVSFEREFRRELDDENADERAAVRRRERACAREGMKRLGIRAERYEDPPVDRVCFRSRMEMDAGSIAHKRHASSVGRGPSGRPQRDAHRP